MRKLTLNNTKEAVKIIKNDGVVVFPTDTLYGLLASARSPKAVSLVFDIKERDSNKPCIIACSCVEDVEKFGIIFNSSSKKFCEEVWPSPVSIILPYSGDLEYLSCGSASLSFRIPESASFRSFLKEAGPVVAPSANPEGLPPASSIDEAVGYFGDKVDAYVDGGSLNGEASTLVNLIQKKPRLLRNGAGDALFKKACDIVIGNE